MKITNIRAVQPIAPTSPPDWRTSIGQILVAVDTDAGITGYGVGGGGLAGVHVVNTVLRDLLLHQNAEAVEELWQRMYYGTLAFGQKGIAIMAISGVDLSLWDIRGKAANKPVAQLLSENVQSPVPTYITVWGDVPAELASQYRAFKLHVEHHQDLQQVERVADAVKNARETVGPDAELMIDAWMKWDVETTLAVAEKTADYNLAWIEEPLPCDDWQGYHTLSEQCPIPIAGGEHEFTSRGFSVLIEHRLHQVLQPDVCWCGGMTELVKIYEMAKRAGLRVCSHRGAELWGLHAVAALDDRPLAESGRPWMTWVGGQPAIENGFISVPDAPGFGVIINEEACGLKKE